MIEIALVILILVTGLYAYETRQKLKTALLMSEQERKTIYRAINDDRARLDDLEQKKHKKQ